MRYNIFMRPKLYRILLWVFGSPSHAADVILIYHHVKRLIVHVMWHPFNINILRFYMYNEMMDMPRQMNSFCNMQVFARGSFHTTVINNLRLKNYVAHTSSTKYSLLRPLNVKNIVCGWKRISGITPSTAWWVRDRQRLSVQRVEIA